MWRQGRAAGARARSGRVSGAPSSRFEEETMTSKQTEALNALYRGWAAALQANPEMPLEEMRLMLRRGPRAAVRAWRRLCRRVDVYAPQDLRAQHCVNGCRPKCGSLQICSIKPTRPPHFGIRHPLQELAWGLHMCAMKEHADDRDHSHDQQ